MLRALGEAEFDRYIDFAYDLALDLTRSAYPTYLDGIKTKADFIRRARQSFERAGEEVLLFEDGGGVAGWIHYYVLPEDRYLSFCAFNVSRQVERAIDEFLRFGRERYPGCTLYFGLPGQNAAAIAHLEALRFRKEETCQVDVLLFENYRPGEAEAGVVRVTRENFAAFEGLHRIHDGDMYWNSARLCGALDRWNIYLLYREEEPAGAIYFCFLDDGMMEIFGVDYPGGRFEEDVFRGLLRKALNEGKAAGMRSLAFFTDEREHPIALELGLTHISPYVLYSKALREENRGRSGQ